MKEAEYYLMRHADFYDQENQFVTYDGMIKLKKSVDKLNYELKERFSGKKLRIYHSTLKRAVHSALLTEEMLWLGDIKVELVPDRNLDSDSRKINSLYVKRLVEACAKKDEVCLILSHQPDIEHFCKKKLEKSDYLRMVVGIEEEPKKEEDDLPF